MRVGLLLVQVFTKPLHVLQEGGFFGEFHLSIVHVRSYSEPMFHATVQAYLVGNIFLSQDVFRLSAL